MEQQQCISYKQGKGSKDNEEITSGASSLAPSALLTPTTLSRQSSWGPSPGSLSHSTSTLSTTEATLNNSSRSEKWCRHCSRAMSCLVIAALQESSSGLRTEDIASFEDSGFGYSSVSGFEFLNAPSSRTSPSSSLFSKIDDSNAYSSLGSSSLMSRSEHRTRQEHTSDSGSGYGLKKPSPTSTSIRSCSLEDAFGSKLATDVSTGSSNTKETSSTLKPTNENQHPPIEDSDLDLVSGSGSAFPSSAALVEPLSKNTHTGWNTSSRTSPRSVPVRSLSGPRRRRTRLEMDLAEAAATPSPGSYSALSAHHADVGDTHPVGQEPLQEPTEASSARASKSGTVSISSASSMKPTISADDSNSTDESVNVDSRVDD
ncbi:hypothetical protein BG011_005266, partial [Mortierella polycephala]